MVSCIAMEAIIQDIIIKRNKSLSFYSIQRSNTTMTDRIGNGYNQIDTQHIYTGADTYLRHRITEKIISGGRAISSVRLCMCCDRYTVD